ncbi:MAG: hypothetical protein Q9M20_05630 [Mariprofundaceae bacterium]|nr:hypothetical protein [Mariprofundaceae bacterium]
MKHACKHVARLTSDSFERQLSLLEQMQLKLHLAMCGLCRNYHQSIKTMEHVFVYIREHDLKKDDQLSNESKKSILYRLKKEKMKDAGMHKNH